MRIRATRANQWAELERWKTDAEPEGVHLDFKQRNGSGSRASDEDLANVAKAASSFANVEGGVLVLGVYGKPGAKDELDRVEQLMPFAEAETVARSLHDTFSALTDPPVPGVQVVPIFDPANAGAGVVAIHVPSSDGGPHQAAFSSHRSRYFIRIASTSALAPHSILAGLFRRSPPPRLRLALDRDPDDTRWFALRNDRRGLAENISCPAGDHASRPAWHRSVR